ncbi:MAG: ABC transporter substrate-binding protein [Spirochaetia bacterium]|nr:ABC transporter substrate-binding protein [Spirochaetia bacterium]
MRKIICICMITLFLAPFAVFGGGGKEAAGSADKLETWLQNSQIGKYQPEKEDWAAIEKAAKAEGTVVVYSNSSKVYEFCRSFYDKYGIKAIPNDVATGDMFEKLNRLQDSGVYDVDVVLVSNLPVLYNEFVDYQKVFKYVPREIEPLILDKYQDEPLGIYKLGGKCVIYNTEVYPNGSPIDSWWDLTRPEWNGRLIMKDPMLGGSDINLVAMFIKEADTMAKAYKAEFGEEIKLSKDVENAGYEFIKRLLDNDMILTSGGDDVVISVGAPGQKNPPIGLTGPSKMSLKEEQTLYADIVWGLEPFDMFMSQTALCIPAYAPNPNAAKLLIKWLYGDENGGKGYEPFFVTGTWPTRTDMKAVPGQKNLKDLKIWSEDGAWLYANVMRLRDFWIQHM